jgi:hypothetical protein
MNWWPRGLILTVAYIPTGIDQESAPMSQRQMGATRLAATLA